MKSKFLSIQLPDFLKGLLMVVITALVTGIYELLQAGPFVFNWATFQPIVLSSVAAGVAYIIKNYLSNSSGQFATNEKGKGLKFPKALILILIISSFGLMANAQIKFKPFGDITKNDIATTTDQKSLSIPKLTFSYFLRFTVSETAFETPLFHAGGGQFFSGTGIGVSIVAYDANAIKKFQINLTPIIDNSTAKYTSASLTAGIPIPKLNLPDINEGIRYDWKAHIAYLQTNVTIEF